MSEQKHKRLKLLERWDRYQSALAEARAAGYTSVDTEYVIAREHAPSLVQAEKELAELAETVEALQAGVAGLQERVARLQQEKAEVVSMVDGDSLLRGHVDALEHAQANMARRLEQLEQVAGAAHQGVQRLIGRMGEAEKRLARLERAMEAGHPEVQYGH